MLKLNPAGSALDYGTFLGGGEPDYGYAIAVDAGGSAYVTGSTDLLGLPNDIRRFRHQLQRRLQ